MNAKTGWQIGAACVWVACGTSQTTTIVDTGSASESNSTETSDSVPSTDSGVPANDANVTTGITSTADVLTAADTMATADSFEASDTVVAADTLIADTSIADTQVGDSDKNDTLVEDAGAIDSGAGFTCNLLLGESPTGQWFDSGFLQMVDGTRWESIWIAHHYTNLWANPNDAAWTTAFDPYPGPSHTCAKNSTAPGRVIFVAAQWTETTEAEWVADLTAIVGNIQTKFPSAKRIEVMALTSGPPDAPCPFTGTGNETIIPEIGYEALDAMPAKYPGLVFSLPHFSVPTCSDFSVTNGNTLPQYTAAGAVDVANKVFGPYYLANP